MKHYAQVLLSSSLLLSACHTELDLSVLPLSSDQILVYGQPPYPEDVKVYASLLRQDIFSADLFARDRDELDKALKGLEELYAAKPLQFLKDTLVLLRDRIKDNPAVALEKALTKSKNSVDKFDKNIASAPKKEAALSDVDAALGLLIDGIRGIRPELKVALIAFKNNPVAGAVNAFTELDTALKALRKDIKDNQVASLDVAMSEAEKSSQKSIDLFNRFEPFLAPIGKVESLPTIKENTKNVRLVDDYKNADPEVKQKYEAYVQLFYEALKGMVGKAAVNAIAIPQSRARALANKISFEVKSLARNVDNDNYGLDEFNKAEAADQIKETVDAVKNLQTVINKMAKGEEYRSLLSKKIGEFDAKFSQVKVGPLSGKINDSIANINGYFSELRNIDFSAAEALKSKAVAKEAFTKVAAHVEPSFSLTENTDLNRLMREFAAHDAVVMPLDAGSTKFAQALGAAVSQNVNWEFDLDVANVVALDSAMYKRLKREYGLTPEAFSAFVVSRAKRAQSEAQKPTIFVIYDDFGGYVAASDIMKMVDDLKVGGNKVLVISERIGDFDAKKITPFTPKGLSTQEAVIISRVIARNKGLSSNTFDQVIVTAMAGLPPKSINLANLGALVETTLGALPTPKSASPSDVLKAGKLAITTLFPDNAMAVDLDGMELRGLYDMTPTNVGKYLAKYPGYFTQGATGGSGALRSRLNEAKNELEKSEKLNTVIVAADEFIKKIASSAGESSYKIEVQKLKGLGVNFKRDVKQITDQARSFMMMQLCSHEKKDNIKLILKGASIYGKYKPSEMFESNSFNQIKKVGNNPSQGILSDCYLSGNGKDQLDVTLSNIDTLAGEISDLIPSQKMTATGKDRLTGFDELNKLIVANGELDQLSEETPGLSVMIDPLDFKLFSKLKNDSNGVSMLTMNNRLWRALLYKIYPQKLNNVYEAALLTEAGWNEANDSLREKFRENLKAQKKDLVKYALAEEMKDVVTLYRKMFEVLNKEVDAKDMDAFFKNGNSKFVKFFNNIEKLLANKTANVFTDEITSMLPGGISTKKFDSSLDKDAMLAYGMDSKISAAWDDLCALALKIEDKATMIKELLGMK